MIDLNKIQLELSKWQRKNFPDSSIEDLGLGMAEEVGEACHHILKAKQGIREDQDGLDVNEVIDAVIDTFIYGIQILSKLNISVEAAVTEVSTRVLARDWTTNKNDGGDTSNINFPIDCPVRKKSNHTLGIITKHYKDSDTVGVTVIPQKNNPNSRFERWVKADIELLDFTRRANV